MDEQSDEAMNSAQLTQSVETRLESDAKYVHQTDEEMVPQPSASLLESDANVHHSDKQSDQELVASPSSSSHRAPSPSGSSEPTGFENLGDDISANMFGPFYVHTLSESDDDDVDESNAIEK